MRGAQGSSSHHVHKEIQPKYNMGSLGLPVSALDPHGNTVVQLQSGDVAEPQHDARSV